MRQASRCSKMQCVTCKCAYCPTCGHHGLITAFPRLCQEMARFLVTRAHASCYGMRRTQPLFAETMSCLSCARLSPTCLSRSSECCVGRCMCAQLGSVERAQNAYACHRGCCGWTADTCADEAAASCLGGASTAVPTHLRIAQNSKMAYLFNSEASKAIWCSAGAFRGEAPVVP